MHDVRQVPTDDRVRPPTTAPAAHTEAARADQHSTAKVATGLHAAKHTRTLSTMHDVRRPMSASSRPTIGCSQRPPRGAHRSSERRPKLDREGRNSAHAAKHTRTLSSRCTMSASSRPTIGRSQRRPPRPAPEQRAPSNTRPRRSRKHARSRAHPTDVRTTPYRCARVAEQRRRRGPAQA